LQEKSTSHFILALLATFSLIPSAVASNLIADAHGMSNGEASSIYERAEKAYTEQRYAEASGWLQQVLSNRLGDAKAHNLMGLVLYRQQKLEAAEAEYRKALEADGKLIEARYNLGIALFDRHKYQDALKYLEEAASKQHSSEYEYNLGLTYQKLGKKDKASDAFERAIQIDGNNVLAICALGQALQDEDKLDKAIDQYKHALEIDPNCAEAHNNLGVAYGAQGQYPESIAEFEEALKANPNLPQAQQNLGFAQAHTTLGITYFKQNQYDKAFEEYKKALKIDPYMADAYYNLALLYQRKGNLKAAIDHYQFAIKLDPKNARAHNNLGVAYTQSSKNDLAAAEFKAALKIDPSYHEARDNLDALSPSGK
jgi:tetratricopeptide (TPR) repeat protein